MGVPITLDDTISDPRATGTQSVPAVERALAIVEALAHSNSGLTLAEVVSACQLPRSSAHCILLTLQRGGYLRRNPQSGRYLFERKLLHLFHRALGAFEVREVAEPHLGALMRRTKLTSNLGIVESNEGVVVARVRSTFSQRPVASWPGKRMELHCTALGKALMSDWTGEQVELFVREHGLSKHNENTIASTRRLLHGLVSVRNLGFAIDDEEDALGYRCVAAPIRDGEGAVVAAVSVSGTVGEILPANISGLADHVRRAAGELSSALAAEPANRLN